MLSTKHPGLADAHSSDEFANAVLDGLSRPHKTLPCRLFYDERGSELFEQITLTPEYYPTRTERAILEQHVAEMVDGITPGGALVEFGAGSSLKTEVLLAELPQLGAYVPIDVSTSALQDAKSRLARRFPALPIYPIVGNFSELVVLPADVANSDKTGFFPGSTIGNLTPPEVRRLLANFRRILSPGGRLIVGVDLKKDARQLIRAYDDEAGVTAAFNLNLLVRINRVIGGTFDVDAFEHRAVYNPRHGRIEIYIESSRDQDVVLCGRRFRFAAGERIHTENSYKYTVGEFQDLVRSARWHPRRVWTDADDLFSVHELVAHLTA